MGGSLTNCVELNELICDSIDEYRNKAIYYGNNIDEIKRLKNKLSEKRKNLFSTIEIIKDYELKIAEIYEYIDL